MTDTEETSEELKVEGPVVDTDDSTEAPPDEFEGLTDEEVEQRRRDAATEIERRQKVAEGQERVGQAAHDYLLAARIECAHTPSELGLIIIDHLTAKPDQTEAT